MTISTQQKRKRIDRLNHNKRRILFKLKYKIVAFCGGKTGQVGLNKGRKELMMMIEKIMW